MSGFQYPCTLKPNNQIHSAVATWRVVNIHFCRTEKVSAVLLSTPVDSGYRPLMNDAREGPQTGYWQNARWSFCAAAANCFRAGVCMGAYPDGVTCVFRSSHTMKRTFCLAGVAAFAGANTNSKTKPIRKWIELRMWLFLFIIGQ